jgi:hypothetical protein
MSQLDCYSFSKYKHHVCAWTLLLRRSNVFAILGRAQMILCARAQWQSCARAQTKKKCAHFEREIYF